MYRYEILDIPFVWRRLPVMALLAISFLILISGRAVAQTTNSTATLSWSAPGDNGLIGSAVRYDLRYTTSSLSEANWSTAAIVTSLPAPKSPGGRDTVVVTGLTPGTTYYFGLKTGDKFSNWSELSNVISRTTTGGSVDSLVSLFLDSLRCDFSGESDSLRIRYRTGSMAGPDSVILAMTTDGTLPTAASTDRIARAYATLRTDTLRIVRTVVESDTVIIGGWVQLGASLSIPKYDTVILVQPPPSPVVSLVIDSLRSDFSSENDSLRVRYVTGAELFPDSVIMALTTNGSLPTATSADRWARAYSASRTDTSRIVRTIIESDTAIVGIWVKDAGQLSAPRYDTVVLIQPTTAPVASLFIDSLRCDFSGESDSLRIRYQTGAQTFPDSVILAITTDGTLPTTTSPDRSARVYAASRTDTSRIVRTIVESDTIIVAAWVKDAGVLSTPRYDTVILNQPTTAPVLSLFIDSLRCDFSGENDSLRIRYQSGTQTFPDSVILAITTNGALPTASSADRIARPYVALRIDTLRIVRTIVESDTLIVGAWVKDAGVLSTPRYDTLIVIQPSLAPLATLSIDSIRYDFSGESDSIRFRYQTSAQTWPESVVVAISLDGSLPAPTSADRWARPYSPGATGSFFAVKSIVEPASVIVGAWVRSAGLYSAPLFDTIAFGQPLPHPLMALFVDSIHCDYDGESDSIRIRYQTDSQTANDSVVIAVTYDGSMPNQTSAERASRAFGSLQTDSLMWLRTLTEPATVIVGGWVRVGGNWSYGLFDTLVLHQPPPDPLATLVIDSLHSDFSGESDSVRIRFTSGTQEWPDSVIVAISVDGSLPAVNGADRRALLFTPATGDTLHLVCQALETDTVIAAGWVRDGNSWSTPTFDTVILSQPQPAPLAWVSIDSVNYDYSGESDSLRLVYQTGTQNWPDSVILALSVGTGLPTLNSTSRWARPYTGAQVSSLFVSDLIDEPTIVVVGGWVRSGNQVSTPVYDTISLEPPLTFSGVAASNIGQNSATIVWSTNLIATSQVLYGVDVLYGQSTARDANRVHSHVVDLYGLSAGTTYHFQVSSDPGNGPVRSADFSFTTSFSTGTQLVITNDDTTGVTDSSATIVWATSPEGSSQVQYGATVDYTRTTPMNQSLTTQHTVLLDGLSPRTLYHYRVVSTDASGNRVAGVDRTFKTPRSRQTNISRHKGVRAAGSSPGYLPEVVNDSVIDPYGDLMTTWRSSEEHNQPQWVEVELGNDAIVTKVIVYWAYDALDQTWMTPQQYSIQKWNGADYQEIAGLTGAPVEQATVTGFPDSVRTSKIRIYQPRGMGPIHHTSTLWITELEVYGAPGSVDTLILNVESPGQFIVTQPVLQIENLLTLAPGTLLAGSPESPQENLYFFEIAADSAMSIPVVISAGIPQEVGTSTRWKVPEPLETNTRYFWRASANHSVYTTVQSFFIVSETHPYPNPYRPDQGDRLTFTGLHAGSNLIILSISGELIKRWTGNTGAEITWDGLNEAGLPVASGTYLWYEENSKTKGKLIVIR